MLLPIFHKIRRRVIFAVVLYLLCLGGLLYWILVTS